MSERSPSPTITPLFKNTANDQYLLSIQSGTGVAGVLVDSFKNVTITVDTSSTRWFTWLNPKENDFASGGLRIQNWNFSGSPQDLFQLQATTRSNTTLAGYVTFGVKQANSTSMTTYMLMDAGNNNVLFGSGAGSGGANSAYAAALRGTTSQLGSLAWMQPSSGNSVGGIDTASDIALGALPASSQMLLMQNTFRRGYFWKAVDTAAQYTEASLDSAGNPMFRGYLTSLNQFTNEGNGAVITPDTVNWTGQTATITAKNFSNTATGHLYEVSGVLLTTTAGTSGTVSLTVSYNDGAAKTYTTGNLTFGVLGSDVDITKRFYVASGTPTWATTVTSAVGSPVYAVKMALNMLW